jgi:hypothetical protein
MVQLEYTDHKAHQNGKCRDADRERKLNISHGYALADTRIREAAPSSNEAAL